MHIKKISTIALTILLLGNPILKTSHAMNTDLDSSTVSKELLLINDLTESEFLTEKSRREKFDENTSLNEIFSVDQVNLVKYEFQSKYGNENTYKLISNDEGIKVEVNGFSGKIKMTSESDGVIELNYFESLDELQMENRAVAPNRPSSWQTQGPDFANLKVVKGATRDTITAEHPLTGKSPKVYTKPTSEWYKGHTQGYYDNVGEARKCYGTAKAAAGPSAAAAFIATVRSVIKSGNLAITAAGFKVLLGAATVALIDNVAVCASYSVLYFGHMSAVLYNYHQL